MEDSQESVRARLRELVNEGWFDVAPASNPASAPKKRISPSVTGSGKSKARSTAGRGNHDDPRDGRRGRKGKRTR
jgi:hypothetical protein